MELFLKLQGIFEYVARTRNAEFMAELWYHAELGFTWYFPEQRAGHAWVRSRHEEWLEMPFSGAVKVGEFHSHGRIPPFFSGIDDNDELMIPGFYGVFGNAGKPEAEWRFRVVWNGVSIDVPQECMQNRILDTAPIDQKETMALKMIAEDRIQRLDSFTEDGEIPARAFEEAVSGNARILLMPAFEAWWWGRFPAFHAVSISGSEITTSAMVLGTQIFLLKAGENPGRSYVPEGKKSVTEFFFS